MTLFTKSIWWCFNPSSTNYLTQSTTLITSDDLSQQLINLAPFGTVKKEVESTPEAQKPQDKIIVYGVYASSAENSIALVTINDKDDVIKIGDDFAGGKVTKILPTKVIVMVNNSEVTYPVSANPTPDNSDFADRPTTAKNDNNNDVQDNNKSSSQDPEINSIAEQRRKMIKQFQKDNNADSDKQNSSQAQ